MAIVVKAFSFPKKQNPPGDSRRAGYVIENSIFSLEGG
jgi:hypothetical protein